MMYTNEEKAKIYENLDKIKDYLDGIRPNLRKSVTVDFGPMKTYANFNRENEYHITVGKNELSGRTGGLALDYDINGGKESLTSTVYAQLDYAVALIQNWFNIKATVNTAIQNQKQILSDINNFEI